MRNLATNLATIALLAAPAAQPPGRWTPMVYTHEQRGAAALDIATSIRLNAFMLTTEERSRLALELIQPHSTDHARFEIFGEPA